MKMSSVNLRKAIEFVKSLDNEILLARLDSIIMRQRPRKSVVDTIEQMRNSDGGFSFWDHNVSSIATTLNIIGWLDDLSLGDEPIVNKTFDFLLHHQQEDGGWDENKEISKLNPPPFMIPGEITTRTWLTAGCAHWFIRFGRAEPPGTKGCPAEFLLKYIQPSGFIIGYLYASWDALVMFNYHPGPNSDAYRNLLKVIEESFEPESHDAVDLTWLLRCLRDVNLDCKNNLVMRTINALEKLQQKNGSWNSGEGSEYSGMTTVDTLRVLRDFGRVR